MKYTIDLTTEQDAALQARADAINAVSQVPVHEGDSVPPATSAQDVLESLVLPPLDGDVLQGLLVQAESVKQAYLDGDQAMRDSLTAAVAKSAEIVIKTI